MHVGSTVCVARLGESDKNGKGRRIHLRPRTRTSLGHSALAGSEPWIDDSVSTDICSTPRRRRCGVSDCDPGFFGEKLGYVVRVRRRGIV